MNVLYLINHAGKAGTERYVQILMEGAQGHGVRPFFAYNEPGLLLDRAKALGAPCDRLEMRGPFDLAAARALAGICRVRGIDLVHTNYLRENYIALLSKRLFLPKLKVVYTNHFVVHNNAFVRAANRVMTRSDHRIISVCAAGVPRLLANGNAGDKIVTIHNAVDPDEWKPGEGYDAARAKTRAAYGLGADDMVFLCASRFARDKGHRFLLDSIARLSRSNVDQPNVGQPNVDQSNVSQPNAGQPNGGRPRGFKLLLAGDGPLLGEVGEQAATLGLSDTVRFAGFVSDIKPLFYAADVYLNPSEHEALSFLILEALASGLPVIATDMGGNAEIVNARHGCGVLVKYGDTEAMAAAIADARTGALAGKKAAALATVERHFSIGEMRKKTFAAYAD